MKMIWILKILEIHLLMNMIMEKNFTCLYCSHETYLNRVYIQQSKSKKHIHYVWHDTSINQIKCICQEHNHFVNEGSLEGVNEKLLKGMRDY